MKAYIPAFLISIFALTSMVSASNVTSTITLNYSACTTITDINNNTNQYCAQAYPNITIPTFNETCLDAYYTPVIQSQFSALSSQIDTLKNNCTVSKTSYEVAVNQSGVLADFTRCIDSNKHYIETITGLNAQIQTFQTCNQTIANLTSVVENQSTFVTGYASMVQDTDNLKTNYAFIGIACMLIGAVGHWFFDMKWKGTPQSKGGQTREPRMSR